MTLCPAPPPSRPLSISWGPRGLPKARWQYNVNHPPAAQRARWSLKPHAALADDMNEGLCTVKVIGRNTFLNSREIYWKVLEKHCYYHTSAITKPSGCLASMAKKHPHHGFD